MVSHISLEYIYAFLSGKSLSTVVTDAILFCWFMPLLPVFTRLKSALCLYIVCLGIDCLFWWVICM